METLIPDHMKRVRPRKGRIMKPEKNIRKSVAMHMLSSSRRKLAQNPFPCFEINLCLEIIEKITAKAMMT